MEPREAAPPERESLVPPMRFTLAGINKYIVTMLILIFIIACAAHQGELSAAPADDSPEIVKIEVNFLGSVMNPGKIEIRKSNPTAFDAWRAVGGNTRLAGDRLVLVRPTEADDPEIQEYILPFHQGEGHIEAKLKGIPLLDQDILFLSERCHL